MPYEESVLDAFFGAANSITSNVEKGRVLRSAAENSKATRYSTLGIINSSKLMTSNTEKSAVLRTVAKTGQIQDEEVRAAYLAAAKTLSSDTDYRNVMEALMD